MKWTVVWQRAASNRLAELWLAAANRPAVSDAANLDIELAHDPDRKGREFFDYRVIDEPPLSAVYHLSASDRLVKVVDVWPEVILTDDGGLGSS
jgi:hypothetical protein